jgi:hypothetical protein
MRSLWIGLVAVFLLGMPAEADKKKPAKGFWKILVRPGAKWVLNNRIDEQMGRQSGSSITVETYDVRKVGDADVARLRWSMGDDTEALKATHAGPITQVAVTSAGLYLLWASMDDKAVAEALKK